MKKLLLVLFFIPFTCFAQVPNEDGGLTHVHSLFFMVFSLTIFYFSDIHVLPIRLLKQYIM